VNSYYETSILEGSLESLKINDNGSLKENIKNYKNKLLSSYWKEINLIGYKIELLEKQKVEYLREKSRIIYLENHLGNFYLNQYCYVNKTLYAKNPRLIVTLSFL